MPPKKGKKNAITCFIEATLIPEKQREGYQFRNGIAGLIPEASRRFKDLPPHEKERYEQMARDHRERNKREVDDGRRDNCGNLISERKDPREMMLAKRKADRKIMREMLHASGATLLEKKFYVIGFEYMIQLEKSETDFDYWPVEVGIVEWSMGGGISREFYRLIYPGDIPLGYRFKFQEHADETHRFTMDQIKTGDNDFRSLWRQMENFVLPDNVDGNSRVLHCLTHQNPTIAGCLDWLHREALSPNRFQIRYLEDLSLELFAHANKNVSESSILEMLTTSAFDYEPNTRCMYHDESETIHCALGAAKRCTFAMSDSLAAVYDYTLTPNHLPTRNIAQQSYVAIGPNQEQLVPDLQRPPAGRGCSIDTDPYSSRDIRYFPNNDTATGNVGGDLSSSPVPRPASVASNRSVGLKPPPASRLPTPAFHDDYSSNASGVEDGMRYMSLNQSAPQLNPVMPTRPPMGGPPVRPPPAAVGGPGPRPPPPAASWRNPAPGGVAPVNPAPPSTVPTFYTAEQDDSDDETSSMMSSITGTSSYLPNYNYAVGDTNLPFGRGMLRPGYAPSEASIDSSSFSLRSTCPGRFGDAPVGRGGVGRGQYLLSGAAGPIGVGRSVINTSDKSVPPPPGFRGTDGFM